MSDSSYTKHKTGSEVVFNVTPASVPHAIGSMIFLGLIPILILAAMIGAQFGVFAGVLTYAGAMYLSYWGFYRAGKSTKYRVPATISIGNTTLTYVNGVVNKSDISRIIMRNHISNQDRGVSVSSGVIVGGSGIAGTVAATSVAAVHAMSAAGAEMRRQRDLALAKCSWRVDLDSGGRAITLAGGLNETTAYGLMDDIQKSL